MKIETIDPEDDEESEEDEGEGPRQYTSGLHLLTSLLLDYAVRLCPFTSRKPSEENGKA